MADNTTKSTIDAEQQYYLAKLLLEKYETFHPFFETQMQYYTVACCGIALGGEIRLDVGSKTIYYDIKTEKKYKKTGSKVVSVKTSKVSGSQYKREVEIARKNLTDWTQQLLWGNGTTVRINIDGKQYK